jgi:hypothetical protein
VTAKLDSRNATDRAMGIFRANGGILNTERAIKLNHWTTSGAARGRERGAPQVNSA